MMAMTIINSIKEKPRSVRRLLKFDLINLFPRNFRGILARGCRAVPKHSHVIGRSEFQKRRPTTGLHGRKRRPKVYNTRGREATQDKMSDAGCRLLAAGLKAGTNN
jgi:hypothetical protein